MNFSEFQLYGFSIESFFENVSSLVSKWSSWFGRFLFTPIPIVFHKVNLQKTLFIPFPTSFYMKMAFLIRGSPSSFLIGQFPLPLSSVEIFLFRHWSVFSARGVVSNKYEDWFSSNPAFALRPKSKQPKLFSRYQTYHTHKKIHHTTNRLVDLSDWRNRLEEKKNS